MQPVSRERPSIRSTLLLALAFIGVALTSWDVDDGRSWSRIGVLALGIALCLAYALSRPRSDGGRKRRSVVSMIGAALGVVVVLTWLVLWAQHWLF